MKLNQNKIQCVGPIICLNKFLFCIILQGLVNIPIFHITQLLGIFHLQQIFVKWWCETNPQKGTFNNPCLSHQATQIWPCSAVSTGWSHWSPSPGAESSAVMTWICSFWQGDPGVISPTKMIWDVALAQHCPNEIKGFNMKLWAHIFMFAKSSVENLEILPARVWMKATWVADIYTMTSTNTIHSFL